MKNTKVLITIALTGLWSSAALPQFPDIMQQLNKKINEIENKGTIENKSQNPPSMPQIVPSAPGNDKSAGSNSNAISCDSGYVENLGFNLKTPTCVSSENINYLSEWELKGVKVGKLVGETVNIIKSKCKLDFRGSDLLDDKLKQAGLREKGNYSLIKYACVDSDNSNFSIELIHDDSYQGFSYVSSLLVPLDRVPKVDESLPVAKAMSNKFGVSPTPKSNAKISVLSWPGAKGLEAQAVQTNQPGDNLYRLTLMLGNVTYDNLQDDLAIKRRKSTVNNEQNIKNEKAINNVPRL